MKRPWFSEEPHRLYFLFLGLLSFVFLITLPIIAGDTDLWFHLNGGRYVFENYAIANTSYFSFLSPARVWANHFWLFQVVVYTIYQGAGYYGLIVFRAAAICGTLWLVFRYLLAVHQSKDSTFWLCVVGMLFFLVLLTRSYAVRPHLVDYVCIVAFIYILERHPRHVFVLVPLSILWSNLHGIAYPAIVLIAGAYLIEYGVRRAKKQLTAEWRVRTFLIPLFLTMVGVLLTPHGLALLQAPLTSFGFAGVEIHEVRPVPFAEMFSFQSELFLVTRRTILSLCVAISALAMVNAWVRRRVRVSHVLLWVGGLYILTRGSRFLIEFALLSLPVLASQPLLSGRLKQALAKPVMVVLVGLLVITPVRFVEGFRGDVGHQGRYPLSLHKLPTGVAAFLNQLPGSGTVLNHPNTGGYLGWALHQKYTIFMDLQAPFLITDADLYVGRRAFYDEAVFLSVIERYHPSFISAPIGIPQFPEVVAQAPQYTPVFFDDVEAVYVDREQRPEVAERYDLKGLDPFDMPKNRRLMMDVDDAADAFNVVLNLLEVNPASETMHQLAVLGYLYQDDYEQSLQHAEAIIRQFPASPYGYWLAGDSLVGLEMSDQALDAFHEALRRLDDDVQRANVYRSIGSMYLARGEPAEAYRALRKSTSPLSYRVTIDELYQLGHVASLAGKMDEAKDILEFIYEFKLGPDDEVWKQRLERELGALGRHVGDGTL